MPDNWWVTMRDNLFKLAGLCCGLGYGPTDWEGSSFPPVLNVLPETERERERERERSRGGGERERERQRERERNRERERERERERAETISLCNETPGLSLMLLTRDQGMT